MAKLIIVKTPRILCAFVASRSCITPVYIVNKLNVKLNDISRGKRHIISMPQPKEAPHKISAVSEKIFEIVT